METVTLSTLVADTGETPRTLQHWTDLGILRAEPTTDRQGRGNRRVYRAEPLYGERKYALLASAMNKLRLPLVEIKHLIYADRLHFDPIDDLRTYADPKHMEIALKHREEYEQYKARGHLHPFEAAVTGEQNVFVLIAMRPHDPVRPFQAAYLDQHGWDEVMAAKGNNKLILNLMADNTSAVMFNLSKIFAPLHRPE